MSLTIREGRLMVEAVRKYQRVFQTGSQQRSMAANRLGCELIRNGRIGKIKKIIAHNYPSPWECALPAQPVPDGLDWDMWCGPTEVVPYHIDLYTPRAKPGWISFRPYSGGEMTGWGCPRPGPGAMGPGHGRKRADRSLDRGRQVRSAHLHQARIEQSRQRDAAASPRCSSATRATSSWNWATARMGGAIFIGENGTITIDRGVCTSDPPEIAQEPITCRRNSPCQERQPLSELAGLHQERGRSPSATWKSATARPRSATWPISPAGLGRRLRWDPVKETFPDDVEADKYLDRPRRKPYQLPEMV